MDKYNIITPTSDLQQLNEDYAAWRKLPYDLRVQSNQECNNQYGISNIELYERNRALILSNQCPKDSHMIGGYLSESSFQLPDSNSYLFDTDEEEFNQKLAQVAELERSPNIVIINPFRNPEYKDYSIEELDQKYEKYCRLTPKNKKFSNAYSLSIWNHTVYNMYQIMSQQISVIDQKINQDASIMIGKSKITDAELLSKYMNSLQNDVNRLGLEDDTLGLLNIKLNACAENMNLLENTSFKQITESIDSTLSDRDFYHSLPKFVPFLTMEEAEYYGIYSEKIEDYYPGIPINEKSMELARKRQARWLEEHAVQIIDISKSVPRDGVVLESTQKMQNIYRKHNLYPVYIVLSYNKRVFTTILKVAGHLEYSHSGLSMDSDLEKIYTFNYQPGRDPDKKGFNIESLKAYTNINPESKLAVLAFFIDKKAYDKINDILQNHFMQNKSKTHYAFINLFRIFFGKAKDFDPNNMRMVCSQFVDAVLKLANLDLTNKTNNLVTPDDFRVLTKNAKVFKIYEGLTRNYTDMEGESKIYNLFHNMKDEEIAYNNMIQEVNQYHLEAYYTHTENIEANKILEQVRELLKPESIFDERRSNLLEFKFPIKFGDNGDMIIKLYKSLEEQYQEAHRLLKSYDSSNLEGIKHELARLFYVNAVIEKRIKKMERADDNYKKMIDLRARVLNDFKKYFKIVLEQEPDFDFAKYFEESEYYNGEIVIDGSVLKFTGALIKKLLKAILKN